MLSAAEQYLVDRDGNKIGVILAIEAYEELLAKLEELECLRAYDAAKAANDERIPFDQALAELEAGRKE